MVFLLPVVVCLQPVVEFQVVEEDKHHILDNPVADILAVADIPVVAGNIPAVAFPAVDIRTADNLEVVADNPVEAFLE